MRICICILYLILIHSLLSVPQHGQPSERTSVLAFLHSMVSDSPFKNMMKLMFRYKLQVELFFFHFFIFYFCYFIYRFILFTECELAEFESGGSTERIPFVYLPLSGQLVCFFFFIVYNVFFSYASSSTLYPCE